MGLFDFFKPARSVVVVDGISLNASAGLKGRVPPRNQLQILRRLSRFAQREKVEVIAVLSGSPLNKAPAGKKFEEMEVRYSKSEDVHGAYLVKTAKSFGPNSVLVVGDDLAEKEALGSSVRTMRMSTFRKAFDTGGLEGEGGNERGDRSDRGGRDRRRRRSRNDRQDRGERNDRQKESKPERSSAPKNVSEADAINELIDLVD